MRPLTWILLALLASRATALRAEPAIYELLALLPPEDQGAQRHEKHFTVGVPLSNPYNLPGQVQVRPLTSLLLGGSYVASDDSKSVYDEGKSLDLTATTNDVSFYFEYYPVKRSGFHLGAGVERKWGTYAFDDSSKGNAVQSGAFDATYAGPSFGWTWLWTNGITFGFDLSQRKRFGGHLSAEHVASGAPDDLTATAQDKLTPATTMGTLILGYSF